MMRARLEAMETVVREIQPDIKEYASQSNIKGGQGLGSFYSFPTICDSVTCMPSIKAMYDVTNMDALKSKTLGEILPKRVI